MDCLFQGNFGMGLTRNDELRSRRQPQQIGEDPQAVQRLFVWPLIAEDPNDWSLRRDAQCVAVRPGIEGPGCRSVRNARDGATKTFQPHLFFAIRAVYDARSTAVQ